jgi:hypothetical protein
MFHLPFFQNLHNVRISVLPHIHGNVVTIAFAERSQILRAKVKFLVEPHDIGKENARILAAEALTSIVLWQHSCPVLEGQAVRDLRNRPWRAENATYVCQYHGARPNFFEFLFPFCPLGLGLAVLRRAFNLPIHP